MTSPSAPPDNFLKAKYGFSTAGRWQTSVISRILITTYPSPFCELPSSPEDVIRAPRFSTARVFRMVDIEGQGFSICEPRAEAEIEEFFFRHGLGAVEAE